MTRCIALIALFSAVAFPNYAYAQEAVLDCQVGPSTDLSHGPNLNVVTCKSSADRLGLLDINIDDGGCDISLAIVDGRTVQWKSEQMQSDQAAHAGAFGILDKGEIVEVFVTNECRLVKAGFITTISDMTFGFAEEAITATGSAQSFTTEQVDAAIDFIQTDKISDETYMDGWCGAAFSLAADGMTKSGDTEGAATLLAMKDTLFNKAGDALTEAGMSIKDMETFGSAVYTLALSQIESTDGEPDYTREECLAATQP